MLLIRIRPRMDPYCNKNKNIEVFIFIFMYFIQHCFICRPSDSTVSEDGGIEPKDAGIEPMKFMKIYLWNIKCRIQMESPTLAHALCFRSKLTHKKPTSEFHAVKILLCAVYTVQICLIKSSKISFFAGSFAYRFLWIRELSGCRPCRNLDPLWLLASVTASVADPWHFWVDPDPDPVPQIHASD